MSITLDEVVPWGRSMEEYRLMFDLSQEDLRKSILGCGDGPASFNREMTDKGHSVISIDPIYRFSAAKIEQRVQETYALVIEPLHANPDNYIWTQFKDPAHLGRHRLRTMRHFLEDYELGRQEGRYLAQSVPNLSFEDSGFDLALCSHFLFLYSAQLSYEFHRNAILELCRVAGELRIFPLLDLACRPSRYVSQLVSELSDLNYGVVIQRVPYEFQRGGNQMMRITGEPLAVLA